MPKRYLILHLNSNGDILYATAIARQLKEADDIGCHITWAVASAFKGILINNPYIDAFWEVEGRSYQDIKENVFRQVEREAIERKKQGAWDEIICPQLMFENMWRYDGTIRRAVLKSYSKPITKGVQPIVALQTAETESVRQFALKHNLAAYQHIVLFECSPLSGQSSVTPAFALSVAEKVIERIPGIAFILSSNKKIVSSNKAVIDGSELSFRENAALTHHCTLLIGCSSGITWISTSSAAKQLPMLQLSSTGKNPVGRDFEREGLDTSLLVEMHAFDEVTVMDCLLLLLKNNFAKAKEKYHQTIPPDVDFVEGIFLYLVNHGLLKKASLFMWQNLKSHSFHPALVKMFVMLPFVLPFKRKKYKAANKVV